MFFHSFAHHKMSDNPISVPIEQYFKKEPEYE